MKKLKIGLVGLPNVGKSTLFGALTDKEVLIANYPFSTIDPNIGLLEMKDSRLFFLRDQFSSEKITFGNFELVDVAGIVRGASQKVGLGGEFLSHIRSLDLICHVVRCFSSNEVVHVESQVDAVRDFSIIQLELILADISQIEKRVEKLQRLLKKGFDSKIGDEISLLQKITHDLQKEVPISQISWLNEKEKKIINCHNFLTNKPSLIIANYDGYDFSEVEKLKDAYGSYYRIFPFAIKLESDLKELSQYEKDELGWESSFNDEIFFNSLKGLLNLKTFFTAGKSEARSWIVNSEATAVECAGMIHSDIQNRFIKAEVYHIDDLKKKTLNLQNLRKEPACYVVKEGDVCNFLFNR